VIRGQKPFGIRTEDRIITLRDRNVSGTTPV
ncbi:MAG: hypothetical protein ACI85V_001969, partial [bacterium]